MNLRPYQRETADLARDSYRTGNKRIIACLPTGAGKTVLFSYLVSLSKKKVLILTDRTELLKQASGTLASFGIQCSTLTAGERIGVSERVVVAMVETWIRRIKKHPELTDFSLVIIDECHKGCFRKALDALPSSAFVLGTTATPLSSKKQFPLKDQYQDIINTVDIPDLIEMGFLNPSITYSAKMDRSGLRMEAGEYSDASQMSMYDKREVYEGLIKKWRMYAEGRKTICFNVNVEHSLQVCNEFNEAGISAMHLDGNTPEAKREQILSEFRDGRFQVLCNVGIVTTGYDEPTVTCIIVNRATTSMPLYLQMCGRGSRLSPGKSDFIILDMGENYKYLNGTWDTPRDWKEIFAHPKKANEGLAPVKKCPNCEAIIRASLMQCPYCFHVITPKEQAAIDKDIEFELIKMQPKKKEEKVPLPKPHPSEWAMLDVPRVAELVKSGTYKPGWAARLLRQRPASEKALQEFSNTMGYKPTWVNWALSL
jgi:superfamily II DNA or RNA helicase